MNGETGKLAGIQAVYATEVAMGGGIILPQSNSQMAIPIDYNAMNGTSLTNNVISENDLTVDSLNAPSGPAQARGSGTASPANSTSAEADSLPLETLKQLLSTQLDYYFSRYIYIIKI